MACVLTRGVHTTPLKGICVCDCCPCVDEADVDVDADTDVDDLDGGLALTISTKRERIFLSQKYSKIAPPFSSLLVEELFEFDPVVPPLPPNPPILSLA